MKKLILILILILPFVLNAQVNDDFEDGNIDGWTESTATHWEASDVNPLNGTYSLHHAYDNSGDGTDQISTDMSSININAGTVTWRFQVKHGYSPSGSNNWSCFLFSDADATEMYPSGTANGYAVGVNYSGADDIIRIWKITSGSGSEILNTSFNWQDNISTSTIVGFEITRTTAGEWTVYIDQDGGFDNLVQIGSSATNTDHITANHLGFYYEYTSSQDLKLWLDDVSCFGASGNDEDSQVSAGTDPEPATISSLENTADGVQVFDVTFTDLASGDLLPTIIDNIQFTQGDNNDISDWTDAIAGAKLIGTDQPAGITGTVNATTITFADDDFISIADGGNETYQLYIWLNTDLSNITDNENFEFKLDYNNIMCDYSGSSFGSGVIESGDDNIAIDIDATQLYFSFVPYVVAQNTDFSLSVAATDANNNIDIDASNSVTLSLATGSGNLTAGSGLTQSLVSGEKTWADLQYDVLGYFSIFAETTGLTSATTPSIECAELVYYLNDDFEDGDIIGWQESVTSHWEASDNEPINGAFSLRQIYDNQDAGIDVVAHPLNNVNINEETKVWRFQVKYENSAPSGNNHWSVFLLADSDETEMLPEGTINGYVFGINFEGTNDTLTLWNITNGISTEVIKTTFDWNETEASEAKGFEISRTNTGEWEIKIDDENGGFDNLTTYGTGTDDTHTTANYFGIYYKYSSTQDLLLTFDDVYFGPIIPDNEPPTIDTIIVLSPSHLQIQFSENLEQTTAETLSNYTVNSGIGNPTSATLEPTNHRIINLEFGVNFNEGEEYTITIENVEDENGNAIETVAYNFTWTNITLSSIIMISDTELELNFSKLVEKTTAETISNYSINNGIGTPTSAIVNEADSSHVNLVFANEFQIEQEYILTINNVEDRQGNVIAETNFTFIFYLTQQFDIVINELMIDVNPAPIALPAEKYIELFNTSDYDINLTDWILQISDNNECIFPNVTVESGGYVIICEEEAETSFMAYGTTVPILVASHLTTTTGKQIKIKDNSAQLIETISYSPDWYHDHDKDDGGWSLERIDPENVCNQENNWLATVNYIGGTPGMPNSVHGSNPDNESPFVENLTYISSRQLDIDFSENVDIVSALDGINYILNSTVTPLHLNIDNEDYSLVHIEFIEDFIIGTNNLLISNVSDNCSNVMTDTTITFTYERINPYTIEPKSENQIKIYFTETVEQTTAENTNNYVVDNSIGNPIIAMRDANDSSIVHLQFETNFAENQSNTITISGIKDINDNMMDEKQLNFTFHTPQAFDVVINELMLDVNPEPTGLPAQQYFELYNTTEYEIWLSDWIFQAEEQSERIFPTISISPNEYLIVCNENYTDEFKSYGKIVGILGSSDLTQTGKELEIKTNTGTLIYYLTYSDEWYQDDNKDDGAWSLEKIDYNNFCSTKSNWAASVDIAGGTPGAINSIYAENNDENSPELVKVIIKSSNHLLVQFSKNISFSTALNPNNYAVSNNIGNPTQVAISDTSYSCVELYFENQFIHEQENTLTISNITDDCDNIMETTTSNFIYYLINPETVWVLNSTQLQIKFSEEAEYTSAIVPTNYQVDNQIGNPNQIVRDASDPSIVYLQFNTEFVDGQTYKINIANIEDVNNNVMKNAELEFTYYTAKLNDIAINELLFNPYSGGVDFVELYNRSIYPINILDLRIAKRNEETSEIETIYKMTSQNFIFKPETYLVLTTDTSIVQTDYAYDGTFVQISNMPTYADKNGTVVILNTKDSIIDEFSYNDDMHYALISNTDGVSLERIDYNQPAIDTSNWHSAAQNVGFATPGYENSQYRDMSDVEITNEITLDPKVFSPDNDGYNDILTIYYEFSEGGYIANIFIYDVKGALIRKLVNNELLSISGHWTWDGLDENYDKAKIGIYAVIIEIFDLDGKVKTYKLACAISTKAK